MTPITINTIADLTATAPEREALAARGADALAQELDDIGAPQSLSLNQACDLVARVLEATLLEQPATGEAVDIAGEQFRSDFFGHLQGDPKETERLGLCDDILDVWGEAVDLINARLRRNGGALTNRSKALLLDALRRCDVESVE